MKTATNNTAAFDKLTAAERAQLANIKLVPSTGPSVAEMRAELTALEAQDSADMAAEFSATELAELNAAILADSGPAVSPATRMAEAATDAKLAELGFVVEGMPFKFTPVDLVAVGRYGSGRVEVKVDGYWSASSITMYIERKFDWDKSTADFDGGNWEASISHSSGGRDDKEVPDSLTASENFGHALVALAAYGRSLMTPENIVTFEAAYQQRRAEDKAARDAVNAAKEAAVAADAAMGTAAAKALINYAVATVKVAPVTQWRYNECVVTITAPQRGESAADVELRKPVITVSATRAGVVRVYHGGQPVSTKDAIELLAARSHRTAISSIVNPATDAA